MEITFCVRGVVSPLLANVYLHYVFDLWVEVWSKKVAKGDVIVVRYADDLVLGFQYRTWIVPIPGTTKLHRLEENIGAVNVELSPDDLRELDTVASKIPVQGARYPEELQKLMGR